MKIYLDNCCYNRPFDDQSQMKIHLETQAKLYIQAKIKEGIYDLVWSYILDYENGKIHMKKNALRLLPGERLLPHILQRKPRISSCLQNHLLQRE